MGKKKQKQGESQKDVTRDVLVWAANSRLPESVEAVLSVRKQHKIRGQSKEMYQVCLAVQSDSDLPSRILVLKNDSVATFEIATRHCFEIKEIKQVSNILRIQHHKMGPEMETVDAGDDEDCLLHPSVYRV